MMGLAQGDFSLTPDLASQTHSLELTTSSAWVVNLSCATPPGAKVSVACSPFQDLNSNHLVTPVSRPLSSDWELGPMGGGTDTGGPASGGATGVFLVASVAGTISGTGIAS